VSTHAGARLNSPADPPHLTLGHPDAILATNVRWGGGEKRDSYTDTRVNTKKFAMRSESKQVIDVMKSHQYFWVHA
jgi:hypothetical protein